MAHWQKTVHGYSGMRPVLHEVLFREMRRFPDEASIAHLLQLGVSYIVVHPDMYPPEDWKVVEARLAQPDPRLLLKYSGPGGRVLRPVGLDSVIARVPAPVSTIGLR